MNLELIFGSAIIAMLISGGVGVIGMLVVYQMFPDISGVDVPTCECVTTQEKYESLRQTSSILGWFFGFIPFIGWRIYVGRLLKIDDLSQRNFSNVERNK